MARTKVLAVVEIPVHAFLATKLARHTRKCERCRTRLFERSGKWCASGDKLARSFERAAAAEVRP